MSHINNSKAVKSTVIIINLLLIVFFVFIFRVNSKTKKDFIKKGEFTVGKIDTILNSNGSDYADFVFVKNDIEYFGSVELSSTCESSMFKIGKKYLVVFLKQNLNKRQMLPYRCEGHKLGDDLTPFVNRDSLRIPFMCADLSWW